MAKVLSWFTTKRGKIFTRTCVGITAFSSFAFHLAIHGPCQDKVQQVCHLYHHGKPKPLSDKVQFLINEVLKDCNLKEDEKARVKFFNAVGQELSHIGGTNSPFGATIGIPFYFEESRKINFGQLRLQGYQSIDWIIEGQLLMEALTLSDKAKKFGLMREIYSCNIWNELDNAAILPFCILFPAEFARRVNIKRDSFNRVPLRSRMFFYLSCIVSSFLLYRLLKDPMKHISDKKSDEKAALTSAEYLEGGIEFYEHVLMQNKALRDLLGKAGESQFDKQGNENYFIFAPKLPTSKRIEYLKKLQEIKVPVS